MFFSSNSQMGTNHTWYPQRKVAVPKWMDPSFFANEGFHFQELLQFQGLSTFVSLNSKYASKLVNDFYRNLKLVDGDLVTEVKGTPIRITPSVWFTVTRLRHKGVKFTTSEIPNWEGYDKITALKAMLKDPSVVPDRRHPEMMVGKLTVEDRMLHYALKRILIPIGYSCTWLSEEDVFVLWLMKQRVQINWPFYMSNRMIKVKEYGWDLPYACLITKFLFYFQIDTRSDYQTVVNGFNRFGRIAMSQMKLKKVNGVWVTPGDHPAEATGNPVQADRVDEPHDMDTEKETQHPPAPAALDDACDIDAEETQHPSAPAALDEAFGMDAEEPQHPLAPAAPDEAPAAPDDAHDFDAEETQHPPAPAALHEAHGMDAEEPQHPLAPAAPVEAHGMDAEETQHPSAPSAPDEAHGMDAEEETQYHPPAPAAPDDRFDLLIAQMQDLKKFIGEGFDHLGSSMASLDARMKVLENRKRLDNLASFTVSLDARIKSLEDRIRDRH